MCPSVSHHSRHKSWQTRCMACCRHTWTQLHQRVKLMSLGLAVFAMIEASVCLQEDEAQPWSLWQCAVVTGRFQSVLSSFFPRPITRSVPHSWLGTNPICRCPGDLCTSPARPHPPAWSARPLNGRKERFLRGQAQAKDGTKTGDKQKHTTIAQISFH